MTSSNIEMHTKSITRKGKEDSSKTSASKGKQNSSLSGRPEIPVVYKAQYPKTRRLEGSLKATSE